MNLFVDIEALVRSELAAMRQEGILPAGSNVDHITVEPPREAAHGDMSTNAALLCAKFGVNPREFAEQLGQRIGVDSRIVAYEVAGPGFLNLWLRPSCWHDVLQAILIEDVNFGQSKLGANQNVNIEFVSANPTGPLHVGHTRGAIFGDALANLLEFAGYSVTREYYINDGGAQMDALARSTYLRYLQALGQDIALEDTAYPGDYLIAVGQAIAKKWGDVWVDKSEDQWLDHIRNFATDAMMDIIREDLSALGIEMDVFFSEKSLYGTGRIEAALQSLDCKGLIYRGTLEQPKGKGSKDWVAREQMLFKSTEHGDDVDRPLQKSDGTWTYFAPDVAYHFDKVSRGFDVLINVFGADHGGYVKRMKAAVSALSDNQVPLDIKLIQLVRLFKNGEPFKMSKRSGSFVTLRDLLQHVGPEVTRFVMLTRKNDAMLDFDFAKVLDQSRDNPVFYVQYANARVMSVFRRAREAKIPIDDEVLQSVELSSLTHDLELAVLRKLAEWPRLIEAAARANEPHKVAFYLNELASEFHRLWNGGNDYPTLRFVQPDNVELSQSKIALGRAVSIVIALGLGILGVTPAQEMR